MNPWTSDRCWTRSLPPGSPPAPRRRRARHICQWDHSGSYFWRTWGPGGGDEQVDCKDRTVFYVCTVHLWIYPVISRARYAGALIRSAMCVHYGFDIHLLVFHLQTQSSLWFLAPDRTPLSPSTVGSVGCFFPPATAIDGLLKKIVLFLNCHNHLFSLFCMSLTSPPYVSIQSKRLPCFWPLWLQPSQRKILKEQLEAK